MRRFLLACLGMLLLGTAGLIILHQVFDSPTPIQAEPIGGPGPMPGSARPTAEPGQYKELVPPLLGALTDADGGVRQLAAASLVRIGADAVPPLTQALTAKDKETRANAAYVLGLLGDQAHEALKPLAAALKDEDKEVRRRAAYAIHQIIMRSADAGSSNGLGGAPGAGGPPMHVAPMAGVGPSMGATVAPWDPGLLVPPITVQGKPDKGPE